MAATNYKFLILEDHESQRNILKKMLETLHAREVHAGANGQEGLEFLRGPGNEVDIVITDLDMPAMDGLEFIRHVGAARYGISLIVASSHERNLLSSVETMAAAYGIRYLGTIEKPITLQKLEELIALASMPAQVPSRRAAAAPPSFTCEQIRHGLENDQFEPFFQPKVTMATSDVMGAEALARWRHPELGIVAPSAFVPHLEESGGIELLLFKILEKAARFACTARDAGHAITIAVNLSIRSLDSATLAHDITDIVRRSGAEPRDVVLEITESSATTDVGLAIENLARLRMLGFGLSIDDYGTGYSSMEQLSRIPFTELKIDQSFVSHAGRQESAKVILGSSLEMARRLKINAVAEGVETRANWDLLKELGCDIAQGYYIARPMPASDFLRWMREWPQMRVSQA
jgi:EAL domain-containing protein (putative c-di-GMP-specific phosphodiesterase class I)/FixJ family two-component response regulator